ncbi:MAG: site-specific DNA-methyltransferase [Planctomycetes bacterium]|nr:site-specific DNA-methyltransferase [Planctomycetota bacterium]
MRELPDAVLNLVYIDPPFMTNSVRQSSHGATYEDRWSGGIEHYKRFLRERLVQIHRLLRTDGTIHVHIDHRVAHHVRLMLDEIFGAKQFLNEIIWSYRTGGVASRWFSRKHDTILAYAKVLGEHTFHPQRGGTYRTDGLNIDETGRPFKNTTKGRLYFHADGPTLTDVWDIPFLSTVSRERTGYPTQKPEALLQRIILAGTNAGDVVADFFCGSGTTLAVAKRTGRKWLGCDCNSEAVAIARERLARIENPPESP